VTTGKDVACQKLERLEVRMCADPLALGNPLETISLADRQTD